jgi:hypothetical protein
MVFTSERFLEVWPSFEMLGWNLSNLAENRWIITAPENHIKHQRNHAVIYTTLNVGDRIILVPDWLESEWERIKQKTIGIEKQLER